MRLYVQPVDQLLFEAGRVMFAHIVEVPAAVDEKLPRMVRR